MQPLVTNPTINIGSSTLKWIEETMKCSMLVIALEETTLVVLIIRSTNKYISSLENTTKSLKNAKIKNKIPEII